MKVSLPDNEAARLGVLHQYKILNTPPEEAFDELTRLAAHICRTPIALIAFVDNDREWFKSKVGLNLEEMPRDVSFSTHVTLHPDRVFIVSDALADERFKTNPLVTSYPKIRFYAGMPLVTSEGHTLGALCVIGHLPRDLSLEQMESLRALGQQVMVQLELRRNLAELENTVTERKRVENALSQAKEELELRIKERTEELSLTNKELTKQITERKQAEWALHQAKEELELRVKERTEELSLTNKELIREIAERKQAEWALHQAKEELELRVKERTEELYQTNDELKKKISEREQVEEELQKANEVLTNWVNELEQRNRKIILFNEMGELLQAGLSADEAYNVITNYAQKLFPGDSGALYVLNDSLNLLEAVALWGEPLSSELVFVSDKCWALRRGRFHAVEDPESEPLCQHLSRPLSDGYLCVPMVAQGKALGMLHLRIGSRGLSRSEWEQLKESAKQQLAVAMAARIALVLANLKLRDTLRNQSIYDPLTSLFNRRYMEETLKREISRVARKKIPLGIIMIDIDHFKRFNDTFGHAAGDTLLRKFSTFLQTHIRRGDIACRYGGEEFVLILPEASLVNTHRRAEQLREEVKRLNVLHHGRFLGPINLSMGVVVFSEHGSTVDSLLKSADTALYQAKTEGRDRVVVGETNH